MLGVVDLFCGVGGLTKGFQASGGFQTLLANDVDEDMCRAFALNFPDTEISSKSIAELGFKQFKGAADVVIGGPPCQAYSTSGKRMLQDPRTWLYKEYYRALDEIQPRLFVYENVTGLLSIAKGDLFRELRSLFESIGYRVQYEVLNAKHFGVPQDRKRVIVVGTRKGVHFRYPAGSHVDREDDRPSLFADARRPCLTLADALSDLPPVCSGQSADAYGGAPQNDYQQLMRADSARLQDHSAPTHSESLMTIIKHVPEGGLPKDMPEEYRPKSGFPNSYGRLWWDRPSHTITRNFGTPSSARCIHPKQDRALTTREGARLQSFSDDFVFFGSRSKKNLQIGNAVPPLLARKIADQVKAALQ